MFCCVCLLDVHNAIKVSDKMDEQLNIAEIISKYFWLKHDDIRTSQICTICWAKIYNFHVFYETVEKAHKDFESVQDMANIKKEDIYFSSDSIKQEEIDEEEYIIIDKEVQVQLKINLEHSDSEKNPLAENEQSDNGDRIDYYDEDESNVLTSDENQLNKTCITRKTNALAKKSKIKKKSTKCRKKKAALIKPETKPKRKKSACNRLDPLYTEEMIRKHIPMGCNLCVFVGETFADIVLHFKVEHSNVRPYITCCDKTFTKRFYVAQHAMTHENPVCFSCELCNKSFTTTGGLQKHNIKYHAPEEERTFACELCPEKFARQHLLQLHRPSHIPREEWKFFCTKCSTSKTFASAYLLNIHDNKLHKREKNVCNICAKEIKDKKAFEKHVREHTEGSGPRLKCPLPNCDSWLKDKDNLKVHLRRHKTDNEIHQCPLCDRICPNRRALASHKIYVHTKAVFKCEYCDKSFKRAITLREHVTQHTGEVLYNCPFCSRTFNSNANMHSHKKKQHPVEWEALKKQKMGNNPSETVERKKYKKHNNQDRKRIIETALRGDDWKSLAQTLEVNYKTAHRWVMDGRLEPFARGGKKPKLLSEEERDVMLQWVKEKPSITLQELKIKVQRELKKSITTTTISNNLIGKMYTMKSFHYEPVTMNIVENNQKEPNM